MLNNLTVHNNRVLQQRAQDAELLKESGAHKLVIADRDGNCLAFVLAWDSFDYDAETDTYVCIADGDGRELMTVYTAGEIKAAPGTNMYVVTAPDGFGGRRTLRPC
jgi:Na+-translocating ferredoxin:NAD+ oxidoreductase RnfG subunit